jgi:hypothetical protein
VAYKNIITHKDKVFKTINTVFKRGLVKWECLRRDAEYRKCYEKDGGYKNIMGMLINPNLSDKDIYKLALKHKNPFRSHEVRFISILGCCMDSSVSFLLSPDAVKRGKVTYNGSIPSEITLAVNLNYTKEEIMEALEAEIDTWFGYLKYKGLYKRGRTQDYEVIKRYLKVYDLKEKGMTYTEITKKYYKGVREDVALFQVKREKKKADQLIHGGYVKIW